jgi:hypothetical protein
VANYTGKCKSDPQLSFSLLFISARRFLPKELSHIFSPIPGGAGRATSRAEQFMPPVSGAYVEIDNSIFQSNTVLYVSNPKLVSELS